MCCPGAWKADSLWLFGVQSPLLHLFLAPPFLLLKYSQWDSAQEMCVGLAERILVRFLPFLGLSFSCHCCLVTKLCLTLCDPMACSMPGFPVLHYLPEFAQTHVHWVGDAIQPSYPLSSPSPAFNLSQHQGIFKWVSSSHQVAKILEFQLQYQSFQWTPRTDLL